MNSIASYILAFSGGIFLAMQAGFNTQLSGYLKQPVLAAIATSVFSVVFACLYVLISGRELPGLDQARGIPWYLWGAGGLFSVLGITLYFHTIPRLGISKMIALGLCGQLIFSMIAGKYGWLSLPQEPITFKRLLGALSMILGMILLNTR